MPLPIFMNTFDRVLLCRYDCRTVHPVAKQPDMLFQIDMFGSGYAPMGLLLWWGDLAGARLGFARGTSSEH